MQKRMIDGVPVERGSGHVFAGLRLPDADGLKLRSGLATVVAKIIREQELSQSETHAFQRLCSPRSCKFPPQRKPGARSSGRLLLRSTRSRHLQR